MRQVLKLKTLMSRLAPAGCSERTSWRKIARLRWTSFVRLGHRMTGRGRGNDLDAFNVDDTKSRQVRVQQPIWTVWVRPDTTVALAWRRGIAPLCGRLAYFGTNARVKRVGVLVAGNIEAQGQKRISRLLADAIER